MRVPAVASLALLVMAGCAQAGPACTDERAIFQTAQGERRVEVEIADTVESRAHGLMFRRDLPAGQGMLFVYDSPREVAFWMRNTLIALDIIFMDDQGLIRHIHRNARPLDETVIPGAAMGDSQPERQMILEIAGGEADRLGLKTGQPMAHPRLDQSKAAWPCS